MNSIHVALAVFLTTITCSAQGQVNFANKVDNVLDAPVLISGTATGPGPDYTAQLLLVTGTSLTPLTPISAFHPAGIGAEAIADRYWESKRVDVPVQPGTAATFVVRAWKTAFGSYEAATAVGDSGQSDRFTVTVGGGNLPAADLTTLKSFTVGFPEPSTITIGLLGAGVLVVCRRSR